MFRLTPELIAGPLLDVPLASGGVVVFEGRVRNHNEGERVLSLEYEAYGPLAEKEGSRIVEEALDRFEIDAAACVHRVGHLQIGDAAIRVEVAAAHRVAAFEACEWIVDEVKRRVPIWKKEHYQDRESEWLQPEARIALEEREFYSRQTTLPEVGEAGQEKLKNARVLVVGAGGLGSPALLYLAAAGVGTLGVADGELLHTSNLHRQILFSAVDVGKPKAELARQRVAGLNPFIRVNTHGRISAGNALETLRDYDLVLDCTDSFASKFLLNAACVKAGKPLIQASIYQYEGQLFASRPGGPCFACLWPDRPQDGCIGSCAEVGVLGAVPGVFGSIQAAEALKLLLDLDSPLRSGNLVLLDLLTLRTRTICVPKNNACPVCSVSEIDLGSFEAKDVEVPERLGGVVLVDVRDLDERETEPLTLPHVALEDLRLEDVEEAEQIVFVCQRGIRSAEIAASYPDARAVSLKGGIEALKSRLG